MGSKRVRHDLVTTQQGLTTEASGSIPRGVHGHLMVWPMITTDGVT